MSSVKGMLHDEIEQLTEEEARQVMSFTNLMKAKKAISATLQRLATDVSFRIPDEASKGFRVVEPIEGKGLPASELLVESRR